MDGFNPVVRTWLAQVTPVTNDLNKERGSDASSSSKSKDPECPGQLTLF